MIVYEEVGEVTPAMFDFLMKWGGSMSAVPSVVFTGPDKALLDRSARAAETAAKALNWEAIVLPKFRKKAKLEYDRLMRDAHDLRLLGVRLSKYAKSLPKVVEFPPSHVGPGEVVARAPFPGPDQRTGIERRGADNGYRPVGGTDLEQNRRVAAVDRRSL